VTQFGQFGDTPVPGDYDGDGKYDRAVFRPSTGDWWILKSGDSTASISHFGLSTDKPIPNQYLH
jgi:hypothetical protein